jgi:hypothetical protein
MICIEEFLYALNDERKIQTNKEKDTLFQKLQKLGLQKNGPTH